MRKVEIQPPLATAAKIVLVGQEGFGKTTFGAYAPSPLILQHHTERGYQTLATAGRLPSVPSAVVEDFRDLLGWVADLRADPQGVRTLVLDAMTGFAQDCEEHTCKTQYGGDWEKYGAYFKGVEQTTRVWRDLLSKLEDLHQTHRMNIVALVHSNVARFKNPDGSDYDRWTGDVRGPMHDMLKRWADELLFGTFESSVTGAKKPTDKGKGVGSDARVIIAKHGATVDAKSRFGLPDRIEIPNDPAQVWPLVWQHIEKGN